MAKTAAVQYECAECGWRTSKWAGRCGDCTAWGTVAEALPAADALPRPGARAQLKAVSPISAAVPIGRVDAAAARARPTGMDELDRVLGGGLVPGAVVLLAGEPGVGKSTLLLEAGALAAGTAGRSSSPARSPPLRSGCGPTGSARSSDALYLAAETDFGALLAHVEAVEPRLLVVDSVQTIARPGSTAGPAGSPRCGRSPPRSPRSPSSAASRPCWSVT